MRFCDWPERMSEEIARHDRPFSWGKNDCCTFAADVVEAVCGVDHMALFRGQYGCPRSAALLLRKQGFNSLFDYMKSAFGDPVKPAQARRGDVVFEYGGLAGSRLGICVGQSSAFVGTDGIVYSPTIGADWAFTYV